MGSLVPTLTSGLGLVNTLNTAFSAVNALQGNLQGFGNSAEDQARNDLIAEQDLALRQLQARQAQSEQQSAQNAALERERIALEAAQSEQQRQAALRRAVARQRASFGGSGIGSGSGSSEAVLLGLVDESEDELKRREELDSLRTRAIDLDAGQQRSVNVLQATQLAERNNLQRQLF